MEWTKAKWILIVLFAALNVFLAVLVINTTPAAGQTVDAGILAKTGSILAARGYVLSCDIPDRNPDMGAPEFRDFPLDKEAVAAAVAAAGDNAQLTFDRDGSVVIYHFPAPASADQDDPALLDAAVALALKGIGLDMAGFVRDSESVLAEGRRSLIYVGQYSRDTYDYSSRVEIILSHDGIEYLRFRKRILTGIFDTTPIVPAYEVLLAKYAAGGDEIVRIGLGFVEFRASRDASDLSDTAVWRVVTAAGGERYFKAYNGEEIAVD
jgi:hypothetical protein